MKQPPREYPDGVYSSLPEVIHKINMFSIGIPGFENIELKWVRARESKSERDCMYGSFVKVLSSQYIVHGASQTALPRTNLEANLEASALVKFSRNRTAVQ